MGGWRARWESAHAATKLGRDTMSDLRDWAKLDTRWYEDPVLLGCAEEHEACFRMWPVLVAKAKADSHAKSNPDGAITIAPKRLSFDVRCEIDEIGPALTAMQTAGLLSFTAEGVTKLTITLNGFAKWQSPRGSGAERQARYKARQKDAICREGDGEVTQGDAEVTSGDAKSLDVDGDRDGDVDKTPPPTPASPTDTGGGGESGTTNLPPTTPEKYAAANTRIHRELGDLSLDARSAEAAIRDHRGIDLEPSWLYQHLYRPLPALVAEYGRGPVRVALGSLVKRPDVERLEAWLRSVAEREASRPTPAPATGTFAERKAQDDKAAMLASLQQAQQRIRKERVG